MKFVPIFALALVTSGCAPRTFDSTGFVRPDAGFRLPYADASHYQFLGEAWRLDNYQLDPDTERPPARPLDDGRLDLVLHHRRGHAAMWIDSVALKPAVEQTSLRVLAENWVASIASSGYFEASVLGDGVAFEERRYAAELLDARELGLHDAPAYAVLVDIANLNQAEITPEERSIRALVVFVRLPALVVDVDGYFRSETARVLVAGYANVPADFDSSVSDFAAFLDEIEFHIEPARRPNLAGATFDRDAASR